MGVVEDQLAEVYHVVDRLNEVEVRLRDSMDNAVKTLRGEPDHDQPE